MSNEQLVEAARKAIQEVFGDDSVSPSETRAALKDLRDDIEGYLEALPSSTDEDE